MEASKLSKVIATNQCVEKFSSADLKTFKTCLMKELECDTEARFLSKILTLIHPHLSDESVDSLKSTAIGLHDKDKKPTDPCTQSSDTITNPFELLSSNCIDYFASFLNFNERLFFGYLNRHCYIESQKRSFILTDLVELGLSRRTRFRGGIHYNFLLSAPTALILSEVESDDRFVSLVKSAWFASLFGRLEELCVKDLEWLPYVPVDILFNLKNNQLPHDKRLQRLDVCWKSELEPTNLDWFASQLGNFTNTYTTFTGVNKQTRTVKVLSIGNDSHCRLHSALKLNLHVDVKDFLLGMKSNYEELQLKQCCRVDISNTEELTTIFHSDMKSIVLSAGVLITIDKVAIMGSGHSDKRVSSFESMTLDMRCITEANCESWCRNISGLIDSMDALTMRRCCKEFCIENGYAAREDKMNTTKKQILDKWFFSAIGVTVDDAKIKIGMHRRGRLGGDTCRLLEWYFGYLESRKKKILNRDASHVKFESIIFEFDAKIAENAFPIRRWFFLHAFAGWDTHVDVDFEAVAQSCGLQILFEIDKKEIIIPKFDFEKNSFVEIYACFVRMMEGVEEENFEYKAKLILRL